MTKIRLSDLGALPERPLLRKLRAFTAGSIIAVACFTSALGQTALRLTFPPCGQAPGITADANGDKLFVHVIDSAGNDFEVWCRRRAASFQYEFWASFPGGLRAKVDECELEGGKNDVVLHITGATTTTVGTNGGQVINVSSNISKYYHHNLNSSHDFHTIFDYATRTAKRIDTKREQQETGGYWNRYDKILNVESRTIVPAVIPRSPTGTGTASRSSSKAPDESADFECSSGEIDEGLTIQEASIATGKRASAELYYPMAQSLKSINFDQRTKALTVQLGTNYALPNVSLAFPKELFGKPDRLCKVRVDGKQVQHTESVSLTHRTINVPVSAGARTVSISSL